MVQFLIPPISKLGPRNIIASSSGRSERWKNIWYSSNWCYIFFWQYNPTVVRGIYNLTKLQYHIGEEKDTYNTHHHSPISEQQTQSTKVLNIALLRLFQRYPQDTTKKSRPTEFAIHHRLKSCGTNRKLYDLVAEINMVPFFCCCLPTQKKIDSFAIV